MLMTTAGRPFERIVQVCGPFYFCLGHFASLAPHEGRHAIMLVGFITTAQEKFHWCTSPLLGLLVLCSHRYLK
jgi:hypothetical protein